MNELVWFKGMTLAQAEEAIVEMALKECNGNITKAAKLLGIGRSTLMRRLKMKRMGVELKGVHRLRMR